jgi:hypothetical protein
MHIQLCSCQSLRRNHASQCHGTCMHTYIHTHACRFMNAWYHTPMVYRIWPAAVTTGTIIAVEGRFNFRPFTFEKLQAPNQEIPLASVKGTVCMHVCVRACTCVYSCLKHVCMRLSGWESNLNICVFYARKHAGMQRRCWSCCVHTNMRTCIYRSYRSVDECRESRTNKHTAHAPWVLLACAVPMQAL